MPDRAAASVTCAYCTRPAHFVVSDTEWKNKTRTCGPHLLRTVRYFHDVLNLMAVVESFVSGSEVPS